MVSTTTFTSLSCKMGSILFTNSPAAWWAEKSRMSQMYPTSTGTPARLAHTPAFWERISHTPLPTVPKPRIATFAIACTPLSNAG